MDDPWQRVELEEEVDEDDYQSEPTFPTTRRMRLSRRQRMRENPPPTMTLEDNQEPVMDDLVAQMGWARSVEEFYHHGDSGGEWVCDTYEYSHIALMGRMKIPREFWSLLVGDLSSSGLWPLHIDAWIRRWLRYRQYQSTRSTQPMRWTIMPTNFDSLLQPPRGSDAVKYADGNYAPYPAWADIDIVFIPFCVNENNWLLAKMDLLTAETSLFCSSRRSVNSEDIKAILKRWAQVMVPYKESFSYLQRSGRIDTPAPTIKFAKQVPQGRAEDSGVFICMFIHKLVQGKTINLDEGVDCNQTAMDYRRLMARDFYSYRYSGVGSTLPFRRLVAFDSLD